ncbi:MAG: hypothetical protein AAB556_01175 [Patescibacteria group bacterium]
MNFFKSLKFALLLLAGIFVAYALSNIYEWHFHYWWVDIILHFVGGFWVFVMARYVMEHYKIEITGPNNEFVRFIVFVSFVSFLGVLCEFYEFIFDRYITLTGFTYLARVFEDTLLDLAMDIIGGISAFLLYFKNGKA